jgi:hypothetical protein
VKFKQMRQQRQMEPSTEPSELQRDPFQEFAMLLQRVHEEVSEVSNQVPSKSYPL